MSELRENEQKTMLTLEKLGGRSPVAQIVKTSGLAHAAVMRAALSLSTKKLLPERRSIRALIKLGGEATVEETVNEAALEGDFTTIASGWLHRKNWVTMKGNMLKTSGEPPMEVDEKLLSLLQEKGSLLIESISKEMKSAAYVLKKRKLIEMDEKTLRELELTDAGWKLVKRGIKAVEEVSQLTPELILSKKWQKVKLRKFDVTAPGPVVYPGKIHPASRSSSQRDDGHLLSSTTKRRQIAEKKLCRRGR